MTDRSGTFMLPSIISIYSLNSAENLGMCSTDKPFSSEAAIHMLCSLKMCVLSSKLPLLVVLS
jgi:hypothetical protein